MKRFILLSWMIIIESAYPVHLSLGYHKIDDEVQGSSGEEISDPWSPNISVGHNFNFFWGMQFSPQLGYIKNKVDSGDDYGNHRVETLYFLWDVLWDPWGAASDSSTWLVRFGLGNYIKTIEDDAGTVTVPNGTGTATAYRASGKSKSYSSTLNLGVDYRHTSGAWWFKKYGVRFETFMYGPLKEKKRQFGYLLSIVGYFK